ncbi:MAG TPA: M14 family zinc carboxypeptidase [Vicinamibacterales bacterium]|nr:M14 family zinc carboxypeptidase [Vicinamibacterales bacterium]
MLRRFALTALTLTAFALTLSPAGAQELAPGTKYDPKIPALRPVLGWDFGERITPPDGIAAYLRALAAAAPERTRLIEYAKSWEGRPLHVLIIGSPERIANLDAVKKGLQQLADPRGIDQATADRLVREMPVVVWLMHAVHGNEISSSDAALAEAYHLLAAQGDAGVDLIRREALVVIDPLQNPDGRARFVQQNLAGEAATPDPHPASLEHDEPWPGGRSNHYLFDMNRDWFSMSQPETRGRAGLMLEFYPHVVVDLHEMGGNSTYYFAPPADPLNPYITKDQQKWFDRFGRNNAAKFDERGFGYFIRETFDSFYPGYGESWPIFHGAVGMTYEQASSRGLRFMRDDDTELTYRQGVVQHFTAAIQTAKTAADNREQMVRDYLEYRSSAARLGEIGTRAYVIVAPEHDPGRAAHLGRRLAAQGIEVYRADEAFPAAGRTVPAGSVVVPLNQPAGRLARNLLDADISQGDEFIKEQDRRRKRGLGEQIYDVTAWSLPALYDLEVLSVERPVQPRSTRLTRDMTPPGGGPLPAARVGYLIPWGLGAAEAVVEALQAGLRVQTMDREFSVGGRQYPLGTALFRVANNPADLATKLGAIVARHGVTATPTDTAFVEAGVSLGSNDVALLKAPKVLLAYDAPSSSLSAGWARYMLERRWKQPVTTVRNSSLGRIELGDFDVLVLPSGNYTYNEDQVRRIREWVQRGGTLITMAESTRWATLERNNLLSTWTLLRDGAPNVPPPAPSGGAAQRQTPPKVDPEKFDYEQAIQPERAQSDGTSGAIVRVTLDKEHWLTAGLDNEIAVIVEGSRIFHPLKLNQGTNVGIYAKADRLVAGGLVWPEVRTLMSQKAFLMHQRLGQGHVIGFAEDPNYRAFAEATQLLFINAVLLGGGH